jgi:riboflavin-specific deaminase-like protein
MENIESWLIEVGKGAESSDRPLVTLSYAQSLDGCLTVERGRPTALSGSEALRLTHRLRAVHTGILVGIGTILSDNPRLTVRLVDGPNPQPVVVDSQLRIPLDCALFTPDTRSPWLVCSEQVDREKAKALTQLGARLITCPRLPDGKVDLGRAFVQLKKAGLKTLMVEGGARIISNVLANSLADLAVITICPVWLSGLHPPADVVDCPDCRPALQNPSYQQMGRDMVVWGRIKERRV